VSATREARKAAVSYTVTRPLPEVLEHNRVMRAARAASLAEDAADCLYAVTDGKVVRIPVDRRTRTQIKFRFASHVSAEQREHTVDRRRVEQDGFTQYGYLPDSIAGKCLYATPGLAEALLGELLPPVPKYDWREPEDKARDDRAVMRNAIYRVYHAQVDRMSGGAWPSFITREEAAAIHARIDAEVRAQGYWDDDLPAQWWRDETAKPPGVTAPQPGRSPSASACALHTCCVI
jgi:hypothetical protein